MKKTLLILLFVAVFFTSLPIALSAVDQPAPEKTVIDDILPIDVVREKPGKEGTEAVPTADLKTGIIPQVIKVILLLAGTVSFGVFVYAGVMLVIAQGNEEDITKFKNILIWSIVGLVFITTAYALVRGVFQLIF